MRRLFTLLMVLLAPQTVAAGDDAVARASAVVERLAGEELRGRGAGSPQLDHARDLVVGWMEEAGLQPGFGDGWLQDFSGPDGVRLTNVVGRLPGSGSGDGWLLVGAHYDGLGVGAEDSAFPGEIHPGADDNASGVAALLEAARAVAAEGPLQRTVYFAAFSGEEIGRLGSIHLADHPPEPLTSAIAMLNLDTVGGVEEDRLIVFGTGTAEEFPDILRGVNYPYGFDLSLSKEGAGASDHASFFAKGIPVLHFFSGAKPGYHRPGDVVDLVDPEGVVRVGGLVGELVIYLADSGEELSFVPAGAERLAKKAPRPGGKRKARRVSVGTIPDFGRESGGILLSGVLPGSPAEEAGLRKGDLLVAADETALDNIYDYQGVLSELNPGDPVIFRIVRDGETREVEVTVRARK